VSAKQGRPLRRARPLWGTSPRPLYGSALSCSRCSLSPVFSFYRGEEVFFLALFCMVSQLLQYFCLCGDRSLTPWVCRVAFYLDAYPDAQAGERLVIYYGAGSRTRCNLATPREENERVPYYVGPHLYACRRAPLRAVCRAAGEYWLLHREGAPAVVDC
jgi:hypothetical protein